MAVKAFVFGIISAVSLPLGAMTALFRMPTQRIIAAMMAFGGGALLAALTLDLVAETVKRGGFYPLLIGCILGGFFFELLNQIVNCHGGFLRKAATTVSYLRRKKAKQFKCISRKLSQVQLFNLLPPAEIQHLLPHISSKTYKKGSIVFKQGDPGDSLLIIEHGGIDIVDEEHESRKIAALKKNDVIGALALVTGESRSATAIAASDTHVWVIMKEHFGELIESFPGLAEAVKNLVVSRLDDLEQKHAIEPAKAWKWFAEVTRNIDARIAIPTDAEIRESASNHTGAPVAIWLGILLDGIPESLVIGASLLRSSISVSLLAGLFLSNFPEALSSSAGMRQLNYSVSKILWMWISLMVITGIGAFFGNIFFVEAPHFLFAFIEGMAAGAMLVMIAETMLPEAYHKGGAITGISTLMGFLAAVFFKTLE